MSAAEAPSSNRAGGAWLIADMSLNIWALSIVKWLGADYASTQIVWLRAMVGLVLILPFAWRERGAFHQIDHLGLHMLRVALVVVTLTASFFAIARVPLALFTAIGFIRPIVTMVFAALLMRESIGRRRWTAAGVAFLGILIATNPKAVTWTPGLAALAVVVVSGSLVVILTRRLRAAPAVVLMVFYTAGLALCSTPFALLMWQPITPGHLLPLLLVGVFSQLAQVCFLRAQITQPEVWKLS